jgi:hypothetical protein
MRDLNHANIDRSFWEWQEKDLERRLDRGGGLITLLVTAVRTSLTLGFKANVGLLAGNATLDVM